MPLSAGDRLGPYEVLEPIGAGGMDEVWKARDTRLDRTVAIKTCKVEFNINLVTRVSRLSSCSNFTYHGSVQKAVPNLLGNRLMLIPLPDETRLNNRTYLLQI